MSFGVSYDLDCSTVRTSRTIQVPVGDITKTTPQAGMELYNRADNVIYYGELDPVTNLISWKPIGNKVPGPLTTDDLVLNEQLVAPPVVINAGQFWVADPAVVTPPLAPINPPQTGMPVILNQTAPITPGQTINIPFTITDPFAQFLLISLDWVGTAGTNNLDITSLVPPVTIPSGIQSTISGPSAVFTKPERFGLDLKNYNPKVGVWTVQIRNVAGPIVNYTITVQAGIGDTCVPHFQDNKGNDFIVSTQSTDPFDGYWVGVLKGTMRNSSANAIRLDTSKSPIEMYRYYGPVDNLRDGAINVAGETELTTNFVRVDQNTIMTDPERVLNNGWVGTLQADKKTIFFAPLPITAGSLGLASQIYYKLDPPPKIRPYSTAEYGFNGVDSTQNCSNPVFMLDEFYNYTLTESSMTNRKMGYTQYSGYLASQGHLNKLKTTGVTYVSTVSKVQISLPSGRAATVVQPVPVIFNTTIFTTIPHNVNRYTTVILSGFSGALAALNGTRRVLLTGISSNSDDDQNYCTTLTNANCFGVEFPSFAFPADSLGYAVGITGAETVTVTYGPITPASEYSDVLAALFEIHSFNFKFEFHGPQIIMFRQNTVNQLLSVDTWSNLQLRLNAGTVAQANAIMRNVLTGSGMYNNLLATQSSVVVTPSVQILQNNNPYGIGSSITIANQQLYQYNIPFGNYLEKSVLPGGSWPANIWWRLTGAAITIVQQLAGLSYYGDPTVGRTFESIVVPMPDAIEAVGTASIPIASTTVTGVGTSFVAQMIGGVITFSNGTQYTIVAVGGLLTLTVERFSTAAIAGASFTINYFSAGIGRFVNPNVSGPFTVLPVNQQYFQLGNTILNNFSLLLANKYIFGRIDPAFVGLKNIGYVRVNDEQWNDAFLFMASGELCPPLEDINNPRKNIEAACRVWSSGMIYVNTTLSCSTRCIVDSRVNKGGNLFLGNAMASFFGGDRPDVSPSMARTDTGFSGIFQDQNSLSTIPVYLDAYNKIFTDPTGSILPSKSAAFYPGSVFNTATARVYFLNDIESGSAGDYFPHTFLGANLDKNIGSGVTVKFFGDVNGILCGGTNNDINPTVSPNSYILTNAGNGNPFPPYTFRTENPLGLPLKNTAEPFSMNNRTAFTMGDPGTVSTTAGSATIAGAGTAFSSALVGSTIVINLPAVGTVSLPLNSQTVTGVGTNFTANLVNGISTLVGTIIFISNIQFIVSSVESATSLTVNRATPADIPAGTPFSFFANNVIVVVISPTVLVIQYPQPVTATLLTYKYAYNAPAPVVANPGTVSLPLASNVVTGVGTAFTASMIGDIITIGNIQFTINGFTSATVINVTPVSPAAFVAVPYTIGFPVPPPVVFAPGTVSLPLASATVTGVATAFTAAMVGGVIGIANLQFTIVGFTSGTVITVSPVSPVAFAAGSAYTLTRYPLKPDLPLSIATAVPPPVPIYTPAIPAWPGLGTGPWPNRWEDNAYPDIGVVYSSFPLNPGTVTVGLGSNVVIGAGTLFGLQHVGLGLTIGTDKFLITSVTGVASITVSPASPAAYAGSAYAITFYYPVPRLPGDLRLAQPDSITWFPVAPFTVAVNPVSQPQLNQRTFWRDRWLEQTVYDAINP